MEKFPAPVFAETVLAPNFREAQRLFLDLLIEIHVAHALMLAECGILADQDCKAILLALEGLDRERIRHARYEGSCEDLFFFVERAIEDRCGPAIAGKLHTARSRNDIDLALYRMRLREELLALYRALLAWHGVLRLLAAGHAGSILPAYTHAQPAQPTTLAHLLLAVAEAVARDLERLRAAFRTVNRNPLGACAITTTGFAIDRDSTTRWLAFDGLQLNSYGAIAAVDYLTESASAVSVALLHLGQFVQELLDWSKPENGFLRAGDAWVQSSSIMPQKRNPVALEHARILASKALAQAQAVFTCLHNAPFGDTVDREDDLQPLVFQCLEDATRAVRLAAGALESASFDVERMRERASRHYLTVTELADTLVRREDLSFRQAHEIVSAAVRALAGDDRHASIAAQVAAQARGILGRPLTVTPGELEQALDPDHFVAVRRVPGGPAPEAIAVQLDLQREAAMEAQSWLEEKLGLMEDYRAALKAAIIRCIS
jgi:argininosuccinate lyase